MNNHLRLWNSVERTDPAYTKEFNRGGGFKGTAINPTYMARKATETFGPAGLGWGWKVLNEEVMIGAPISETCNEMIHVLHVEVWYRPIQEDRERYGLPSDYLARVNHFGATTFVGKNKYGPFTDEETKKKSLTDAIGKCLSLLGFSSDVHLGRYDDSKYVNDIKKEIAKEAQLNNDHAKTLSLEVVMKEISECTTEKQVRDSFPRWNASVGGLKGSDAYQTLTDQCTKRIAELKAANEPVAA
jgi:hypothetical protein